ncbi:potassium/proton antiporter membrane subunit, CPA2 family [Actinoplanes regularis]|uniref:Potassium/proton antiporter membrane subunit, CPA2 family n=2 Tax=Actinoplanes regularis TaxID=52697 RepID=A0A239H5T8_9ACTN|nr:cation:proton antiporter [Actinoplanes regularis]GIE91716.1 potassium transporter [Actinoplanes regularis]SNS76515.1 potassium/proton antiporter membrane subunit, CPA2 family [Actinoplanes regularis]
MHHETTVLLIEIGALLFALGMLGRAGRRFGLSPIPLYLLAGLCFGKGGLLPLSASEEFIGIGAQIGVILLLVMLGLEYSADELVDNLRTAAPAGFLDMSLNALPGALFAILLGWDIKAALVLAGITWVSSSGVIAKVLGDLGRLGNRETPMILSVLVIEDLAMAFYLPIATAVLAGAGMLGGLSALGVAVVTVVAVLVVAIRYGTQISRFMSVKDPEALLLSVFGLTLFVAGVAAELKVSDAVGAFLVGIALSGPVAHHATQILSPLRDLFAAVFFVFFGLSTDPADMPPVLLPALGLAVLTMLTKVATGYLAARRAGIALPGRLRAGLALTPRGEFSVVIAGLAVASGVEPSLAPLATAYVLITVVFGPILARLPDYTWFKTLVHRRLAAQRAAAKPVPSVE